MDFWDYEYLNVPMNKDGIFELDNVYDEKWKNVYSIQLTKEDFENIDNLINDFNSAFNIIIDLAEEERLANENLQPALVLSKNRFEVAPDKIKPSIKKVIDAINKAIEYNTFVEFDL